MHNTRHPPADANSDGNKAAFWTLQIAMEWLAATSLLAVDALVWCEIEHAPAPADEDAFKAYEMQGSYDGQVQMQGAYPTQGKYPTQGAHQARGV